LTPTNSTTNGRGPLSGSNWQLGGDGGGQRLLDLAFVRLAPEALLAKCGGDAGGGFRAEIGLDQHFLQLVELGLVERTAGQHADLLAHLPRGARQALRQPLEPASLGFGHRALLPVRCPGGQSRNTA